MTSPRGAAEIFYLCYRESAIAENHAPTLFPSKRVVETQNDPTTEGCTGALNAAILKIKIMPPIIIRTPFAGAERTAEVLGVSPERTRELILLAEQALEENPELRSLRSKKIDAKKKTKSRRGKRKR